MEIERKFLVKNIPDDLEKFDKIQIVQYYVFFNPVVRIRRWNEMYVLTMKSKGTLIKEEYEMEITKEQFDNMRLKAEGNVIEKTRYKIPIENDLICELDIFKGKFEGLVFAEVEFGSVEQANAYIPEEWFGEEVTYLPDFSNAALAKNGIIGKKQ